MRVRTAVAGWFVAAAATALLVMPLVGVAGAATQEPPSAIQPSASERCGSGSRCGSGARRRRRARRGARGDQLDRVRDEMDQLRPAAGPALLVAGDAARLREGQLRVRGAAGRSRESSGGDSRGERPGREREEAQRSERESSERLARIDQEATELVAHAREEAVRDRERIEAAALAEAGKIRAGASRDMNTEVDRARRTLRAHVADLTVSIATGLVRDNISADDQDRMVRQYLDRLGDSVS